LQGKGGSVLSWECKFWEHGVWKKRCLKRPVNVKLKIAVSVRLELKRSSNCPDPPVALCNNIAAMKLGVERVSRPLSAAKWDILHSPLTRHSQLGSVHTFARGSLRHECSAQWAPGIAWWPKESKTLTTTWLQAPISNCKI